MENGQAKMSSGNSSMNELQQLEERVMQQAESDPDSLWMSWEERFKLEGVKDAQEWREKNAAHFPKLSGLTE